MRLSHTRTRSRADSASGSRQRGASVSSSSGPAGVYAALVDSGDDDEPAPLPSSSSTAGRPKARAMSPIARKVHARRVSSSTSRRFLTTPKRSTTTTQASPPAWVPPFARRLLRPARPRRLLLLILVAVTLLLLHWLGDDGILDHVSTQSFGWLARPPPPCRFVSPVEAYFADLARLRGIYNASSATTTTTGADALRSAAAAQHKHVFSSTGHMVVSKDESAPHPIPLLLALGERRWEELLARQSRTLAEATMEYERRYGRVPPKGFDLWWAFASENQLVLPDEYDRINLDLAPFWALPRKEVRRRLAKVMKMNEVFVLEIKNGRVRPRIDDKGGLAWDGTWPRAKAAVK